MLIKTKGFPRDLCENNRFSSKGVWDFDEGNRPSVYGTISHKIT